ncbi:MAG TPA: histidine phosphatase family protein [Acidobacteriaceae bacterium]|nr:histidine phosphatase family protein [Acidobacteriaceae bacterium]
MTSLLFIRHAETDMAGKFCGWSDPPVNTSGHKQIEDLIAKLRSEPLSAVFASDLQRSVTTASKLAQAHGVPCISRTALREIDFGEWEGLTWQEIERLDPDMASRWAAKFPRMSVPRGESIEGFEARVLDELNYLQSHATYGLVALVTHAGVIRVALRKLCGMDEQTTWRVTKPYCCSFRVTKHAESEHRLEEVPR